MKGETHIRLSSELHTIVVSLVSEGISLVDLGGVGKLSVGLQVSSLRFNETNQGVSAERVRSKRTEG